MCMKLGKKVNLCKTNNICLEAFVMFLTINYDNLVFIHCSRTQKEYMSINVLTY